MAEVNRDIDLLNLLRGGNNQKTQTAAAGLYIVKVITAQPEITLLFEGSSVPLDMDLFEAPIRLLPLEEGARYFALPIIGSGQRWGLLEKIDGGEEVTSTFKTGDTPQRTVTVTNGTIKKIE